MTEKCVSKKELREMFVESMIEKTLSDSLIDALKQVISTMPDEERREADKRLEPYLNNPHFLLDVLYKEKRMNKSFEKEIESKIPVDYDSESYKAFGNACGELFLFFEEKYDMLVVAMYTELFCKIGIQLTVT